MDHNTLQNNQTFTESSNLQQSTQSLQEYPSNINYNSVNTDSSVMNDNNIFPTSYVNNNYFNQQPTLNDNIVSPSQSYPTYSTITSSYAPQYGHSPQPIDTSLLNGLNTATINHSNPETISFNIPGYKIIIVPTFSQQVNTYSNYSSDISHVTDNHFTQYSQYQQ